MGSKTKKIFLAFLILAALGLSIAFYFWNKPHLDVADATAVETASSALHKAYITDSVSAKSKYTEQVLEVTGTVGKLSKNQQGQDVVLLKTDNDGAFVNCTMEQTATAVKEGATVTIKGICSGLGQGDADLGILGDVYLVRCYLVK